MQGLGDFKKAWLAAAAGLMLVNSATAQGKWPERPITLVVPFVAGGGTDSIARDIASQLSNRFGQPVIVDNKGGAGGSIGANFVAKAKPDGYTLLFATSTFATNAAIDPKLPYKPESDFAPVAMIGRGPLLLVTNKALGAKSVADLPKIAKTREGGINYCSAGAGSINHLSGELFRQQATLPMTHVPFKGSGPAALELLAGRVDAFFATVPTILPHLKTGKLELLAVTSAQRSSLFPQVPTMAEAGIKGYDVTTWWGVLAPAGVLPEIVNQLNQAVNAAAAAEPVRSRLKHEGATPISLSPKAFAAELHDELGKWKAVASKPGMEL